MGLAPSLKVASQRTSSKIIKAIRFIFSSPLFCLLYSDEKTHRQPVDYLDQHLGGSKGTTQVGRPDEEWGEQVKAVIAAVRDLQKK